MEAIYFPGLNASELNDMGNIARNIFGAEHSVVQAGQGTVTVRVPEPELAALNETYANLLSGRSELQLEVRLYEIDKTKATNVGVILPNTVTMFNVPSEVNSILANNASLVKQLLASDPALAGNYAAILAALIAAGALTGTVFNSPFAVFGGGLTLTGLEWNSTSVNMLLNSSDARLLDQLQLRVLDQEEATIRSGERYPIMTSSYSSLASSSSSTPTIPQIQYQDLGLTLKVKPHFDGENEVSLNLGLKLNSLAGSTINNIPVLNNREYAGVVSLRLGDSALVVSDMSKQDSLEISGLPGLSDIPGFQDTTNRQDTTDSMELVIVVTPHLVRLAHPETAAPMLLLPYH
jgi:type II secretory pathway component GspD/PulD (secretin)